MRDRGKRKRRFSEECSSVDRMISKNSEQRLVLEKGGIRRTTKIGQNGNRSIQEDGNIAKSKVDEEECRPRDKGKVRKGF